MTAKLASSIKLRKLVLHVTSWIYWLTIIP